jgi:hypothetical protein
MLKSKRIVVLSLLKKFQFLLGTISALHLLVIAVKLLHRM